MVTVEGATGGDVAVRSSRRTARESADSQWSWLRPGTLSRAALLSLGVLAVAAVAVVVRMLSLDSIGYNSDEAVYAGQAASITGDPDTLKYFPVFRAHPLLFQTTLSLVYEAFGVSDIAGRLTAAVFGVAAVLMTLELGRYMHGWSVGFVSAVILALMPYHVVVSRQVLLDGPMTLFTIVTIYALARFAGSGRHFWLYAAGVALGLSVLAKETAIVLAGGVFLFLALTPSVRVRLRHVAGGLAFMVAAVAAYPLSLRLAGATGTGGAFLAYQLFRRPNHTMTFYPSVVPSAIGLLVVAAAVLGLYLFGARGWRERLLWSWIAVPVIFFELYPIKGFQYLLPIAAPMAVLAARTLVRWPSSAIGLQLRRGRTLLPVAVVVVTAVSLIVPTYGLVRPAEGTTFLAGTGGVPRGRELGKWIDTHVPRGVTIVTIGPSMANIVQWYGDRTARGLSVSPNPLHRNPVYDPIVNPDLAIRRNEVQYLVWDSFSAARSVHFSDSLKRYVDRYHGREVHRETVRVTKRGVLVDEPVMIVYEVRP